MKRLPILLLLAFAANPRGVLAEHPSGEFDWLNVYQGRSYTLRASVNANPFVYFLIEKDYAMLEMRGDLFPLMGPERITIRDVDLDLKNGVVILRFRSEHRDDGFLRFVAPPNSTETMGTTEIDGLLALVTADSGAAPFVLNAEAGVLHFKGSNHCRGFTAGTEYVDPQIALADGYKLCPACFAPIHLLPDYEKEMQLGQRVAQEVRSTHPAVTDNEPQQRVRQAGQRVLDGWPLPLRGYQYRFTVVEGGQPNAVACPGGWIFVNDGLLEICESDLELEAILSHEISHVEMRHGLRQLHSSEKAARIGGIAGLLLAGVAASQGGEDAALAVGQIAMIVASTATELALNGYSRDMEMEADAAAVHYLARSAGQTQRRHLARILAKLEYRDQCATGRRGDYNGFSTHPPSNRRSDFALNAQTMFFTEPPVFDFKTNDGASFQLEIVGICHHAYFETAYRPQYTDRTAYEFGLPDGGSVEEYQVGSVSETRVFALVSAGSGVKRGTEFKDMELRMDGSWVRFDNKEDTTLYPNASTSMMLVHREGGIVHFDSLVPGGVRNRGLAGKAGHERKDDKPRNLGL